MWMLLERSGCWDKARNNGFEILLLSFHGGPKAFRVPRTGYRSSCIDISIESSLRHK
jgi:hypothetical protein